ncbi:porin family protein [Spirosoma koreense]
MATLNRSKMIIDHVGRKLALLSSMLLVSIGYTMAQSSVTYRLGVTAGVNAAQIKQAELSDLFWRYNAGLTLEQRFSSALTMAYQVLYAKQGSSNPVMGLGGNDKIINELNYLTLPIMMRFTRESKNFFLQAGVQGGYLLNGKGYFASAKNQSTSFRHTHKFDLGLLGGVGYRLGNYVVVDGRYYYGLHPILADYTAPDPLTGVPTVYRATKWYNRVWSLNLNYYF